MHFKLLTWSVMMFAVRASFIAAALAVASFGAQASLVNLVADGQWHTFSVESTESRTTDTAWIDILANDGSRLSFAFTVAAGFEGTLSVTDTGFKGGTYSVFNTASGSAVSLGTTSAVVPYEIDFSAPFLSVVDAVASSDYSHGMFKLGAGSYVITGELAQSVTLAGDALISDTGALKLEVSAVPEPSSYALVLAGLGLVAAARRRSVR
jgi:hypothetical protein